MARSNGEPPAEVRLLFGDDADGAGDRAGCEADREHTGSVSAIGDDRKDSLGDELEPADDLEPSVFERRLSNPAETYRPSLVKLTEDTRGVLAELVAGFDSRRSLLEWAQRLTVRTLGEVEQRFYSELGRQFRATVDSLERVLLSCLLSRDAREREDVPERKAREVRRRLASAYILPARHRAFRELRKDAGEYIGDAREAPHDPLKQRYIAMRPALDELDERQADALEALLDGLDTREEILDWSNDLELATHGEIDEQFGSRCYGERSTAAVLLSDDERAARGRELLAAHHIVPAFNQGVRTLAGRAGEEAHEQREERERTVA